MNVQTATVLKPPVNVALAKSPISNQQPRPNIKVVKSDKYLHQSFAELQQSVQRKKMRRIELEAKLKVLNEKIEAREKRLKEITNKQ